MSRAIPGSGLLLTVLAAAVLAGYGKPGAGNADGALQTELDGGAFKIFRICPGPNAQTEAFTALFEVREGDTIEFCAGRFDFDRGLALHDKRGISVKGAGKDQTVLSFKDSEAYDGLFISRMQGLTIESMTVEDAPKIGVWMKDSRFVTIRDLRVQWSGYATCNTDPSAADGCGKHGLAGLIVDNGQHVLIEDSEFFGAYKMGMLIDTSRDVIARRNRAEYNVVGYIDANAYRSLFEDNLAAHNSIGFFAADVPRAKRHGDTNIVRNNRFVDNNTENFAPLGEALGGLPSGTGMLVLAADQLEIHGNEISDNDALGLLILNAGVPFPTETDTKYDFYPEGLDIHDNRFRDNGGNVPVPNPRRGPAAGLMPLIITKNLGKSAQIAWDGGVDKPNDCTTVPADEDGVPLDQPNPNSSREEGRTDERGRPNFQTSDPDPSCKWNAWKFDAEGQLKPENRLYIQNNSFESTRPQTLLVNDFVNFHVTTTDGPQFPQDLLVPASNDLTPHAGTLPALSPPTLELPFIPNPTSGRPTAEDIAAACGAVQPGEANWNALAHYDCPLLQQYGLFQDPADPRHNPNGGGVPYEINSALFSDYAVKYRFLFLPPGGKAIYGDFAGDPSTAADDDVMRSLYFPVGTVIAKTFAFRKDDVDGNLLSENVVETRLLIKRQDGADAVWVGMPYIWKDSPTGRVAELHLEGGEAAVEFDYLDKDPDVKDAAGNRRRYTGSADHYAIPEAVNCATCHGGGHREPGAAPLSPKPRYLNRDNACPNGAAAMNQLECLDRLGLLQGLPTNRAAIEKHPRWNVPGDAGAAADSPADLHQRARAYLEVNCAHCHTPDGKAAVSGMFLDSFRTVNQQYGICKPPLDGGLYGGRTYDIVPGDADASILHHRDTSNARGIRMPQLARSIVNNEASELISAWIKTGLPALNAENDAFMQNEEVCSGPFAGLPVRPPLPAAPLPALP